MKKVTLTNSFHGTEVSIFVPNNKMKVKELLERYEKGERDFQHVHLEGADLRDMDLSYADFSHARLRFANLRCANLEGAYFRHADLRHADLTGAKLEGVNFRGAKTMLGNRVIFVR